MSDDRVTPRALQLPELDRLPTLPTSARVPYLVGIGAGLVVAVLGVGSGLIMAELWPFLAGLGFALFAVSQMVGYMWRVEAHEAGAMVAVLAEAVRWFTTDEEPESGNGAHRAD